MYTISELDQLEKEQNRIDHQKRVYTSRNGATGMDGWKRSRLGRIRAPYAVSKIGRELGRATNEREYEIA